MSRISEIHFKRLQEPVWWSHDMETLSTLLILWEGNHQWYQSPADSQHKGPVLQCFDILFVAASTSCWTNSQVGSDSHSCDIMAMFTLFPQWKISMMTLPNGNINNVTGLLCGESTGHQFITQLRRRCDLRCHHFDGTLLRVKLSWQTAFLYYSS